MGRIICSSKSVCCNCGVDCCSCYYLVIRKMDKNCKRASRRILATNPRPDFDGARA
uniref:Uncharacterized protein n=1 Tax=Siphoviridae sp. cteoh1 TaxID=2826407 RepID=A0A8S5QKF5_9CAUD|nr:MAG TPA: hypothetical protein [Siphoviridae sp. cteoh1]